MFNYNSFCARKTTYGEFWPLQKECEATEVSECFISTDTEACHIKLIYIYFFLYFISLEDVIIHLCTGCSSSLLHQSIYVKYNLNLSALDLFFMSRWTMSVISLCASERMHWITMTSDDMLLFSFSISVSLICKLPLRVLCICGTTTNRIFSYVENNCLYDSSRI